VGWLTQINWAEIFLPSTPLLEIFLRGTVVYLSVFLMLRFVLKREAGSIGISDLLVVVLLADAAQNAMADDYKSIPDGLFLVATILFWSYALDWLGYRFPRIQRLVYPPPLPLIKNGKMLYRNMRKEFITEEELKSMMRLQGLDDISEVKEAYMEGDGRISIISKANHASGKSPERKTG